MENISKQNNENKISPLKKGDTRLTRTGYSVIRRNLQSDFRFGCQ
jgi:hypothetical protein